ncbi:diacylglycerol kinase family protein [Pseudoflavonifractor sp. CLA-AP-H29]|uniref:Diacylglycerol kinase family protein n=1 Tax=Pseudoflavonifractor intestinihominis TaxID=3133171 RepID=A0ABV1E426_9FIRM
MKHLFIINPAAGKHGSTDALTAQIREILGGKGLDYEIAFTSGAGTGETLARAAAQTGAPVRIYACGGDGTLNEVVNGAAGYDNAAVTNVPKGTGNDFLKIFGKDYRARFSDLAALAEGPQAALDLMDCNGKLGLGVICAGVDARVAADVYKYKALPLVSGVGAYILSLVVNVFKGLTRPTQIRVDGQTLDGLSTIICICNGRYYGGGFMPVGDAQPDDGVLDMLVVPKVSRFTFFRLVGKYAKGLYRQCPQVIRDFHCQEISFTSPEELVAVVDGEVMRSRSFTVRLSGKKINFFYPSDVFWRESLQTANNCEHSFSAASR